MLKLNVFERAYDRCTLSKWFGIGLGEGQSNPRPMASHTPQEKTKSKYRTERKNRDAFRDLLRQHGDEGKITSNTFWGDYAEKALV